MNSANQLTDVTLAPEDGQFLAAHKVVLSSPSTPSKLCFKMNYNTNTTNLLKNMKKNADKKPIKIKINSDSIFFEFSSGSFSQVILPALEAMTEGLTDARGGTTVEVISNNIRTDLINIADSSLLRLKVSNDIGESNEVVVHVYLHKHTMLVQGSSSMAGMPTWKFYSNTYLTPILEASIIAKEREIIASNAAITRKVGQMTSCTKCSTSLKSGNGITCNLCKKSFHLSCTDNKHKKKTLSQKEITWVCIKCRASPPSSTNK